MSSVPWSEVVEPAQDGKFVPVRPFGLGYFGSYMIFGGGLPQDGWD